MDKMNDCTAEGRFNVTAAYDFLMPKGPKTISNYLRCIHYPQNTLFLRFGAKSKLLTKDKLGIWKSIEAVFSLELPNRLNSTNFSPVPSASPFGGKFVSGWA